MSYLKCEHSYEQLNHCSVLGEEVASLPKMQTSTSGSGARPQDDKSQSKEHPDSYALLPGYDQVQSSLDQSKVDPQRIQRQAELRVELAVFASSGKVSMI
jgi:hypothetical protein|tara:strand:+ start:845 stop:1144 length:300 start_codon:yes stop_codon:yes gene_type:complete